MLDADISMGLLYLFQNLFIPPNADWADTMNEKGKDKQQIAIVANFQCIQCIVLIALSRVRVKH